MLHEDNSTVGKVFPNPKASLADVPEPRPAASVPGRLIFATVCGAIFGFLLSTLVAPGFAIAFVVGGGMSFAAGVVVMVLMQPDQTQSGSNPAGRTGEDVRRALADIKGRER